MADNWDQAKAEVQKLLDDALSPLKGINENAGEARRINGVLAGVTSLAGNGEKSVEQQVFDHELPNGVGAFGNYLAELNRKVDGIAGAVERIESKLNEKGE